MIAESPVLAHPTPNFNRLARLYRWMEWLSFGPFLGLCRRAFLAQAGNSSRALILGDGDGRFTSRLLHRNQVIAVEAVDASPAMLNALLRRAASQAGRVRANCIDARGWRPGAGTYDLIVTHFFLDCLTTDEIRALAGRIRTAARPGAQWIVSDFSVPQNRFGRLIAEPIVDSLYVAFSWMTGLQVRRLPDYSEALRNNGFTLTEQRTWLWGLLKGELWALPIAN